MKHDFDLDWNFEFDNDHYNSAKANRCTKER